MNILKDWSKSLFQGKSKHQASKRGYRHIQNYHGEPVKRQAISNHERVIRGRAARMGITVNQYKAQFCK